jgi:hypothetical protein
MVSVRPYLSYFSIYHDYFVQIKIETMINTEKVNNKAFQHQQTAWLRLIGVDNRRHGVDSALFVVILDLS